MDCLQEFWGLHSATQMGIQIKMLHRIEIYFSHLAIRIHLVATLHQGSILSLYEVCEKITKKMAAVSVRQQEIIKHVPKYQLFHTRDKIKPSRKFEMQDTTGGKKTDILDIFIALLQ